MPERWVGAGVLIVVAAVLGGCSTHDDVDVQRQGEVLALVSAGSRSGMDAQVRGVVEVGPGGCLGIVVDGATRPVPVIWPEGSELADADSIDVPEVGIVSVGRTVEGGGGKVTTVTSERYATIPDACLPSDQLFDTWTITDVS